MAAAAVVLVTGAGTGIGRAVVHAFVRQGARVGLVGRRIEKLEEAVAELPPDQVLCCPGDVSDRARSRRSAVRWRTASDR